MLSRAALLAGCAGAVLALAAAPAGAQIAPPGPTPPPGPAAPGVETISAKPLQPLYGNVRSFYGNVRSFWGDVSPFYGNVRSFWGDVSPFYGNVRSFWGTLDPASSAALSGAPIYEGVAPFWESTGTDWNSIADRWQTAGDYRPDNAATYGSIATDMQSLVAKSKAFWGAAVTLKTGRSFEAGFSDAVLARFGINLDDPASFARLSANQQSHFFMDWYDGLMNFSGTDHADYWMKAINWTPKLTQTQGAGSDAVIGLVDQFSADDADTKAKLIYAGGTGFKPAEIDGAIHGAGVLSLINASHDGKGVMGIAPNAKVAAFNPFDADGGAEWSDVIEGIRQVGTERLVAGVKMRASVINLSLGVANTTFSPEWKTVFKSPGVDVIRDKVLYVIAAGNDGFTQTSNVEMGGSLGSTFLVVGSVDPAGKISAFSNTPGDACLLNAGKCDPGIDLGKGGYLKNRFIVAPGELILVSDGKGGVTRQSGTSLAAPLVAGTVALIQDRWPWLKDKPRAVAKIVLDSARDVGAPGVDGVYGVGMLDVEAAQAPLKFSTMKFTLFNNNGTKAGDVRADVLQKNGLQSVWKTANMYLTGYETILDTNRDFLIPLSSTLYGSTRGGEYFQDFVYDRMTAWISAPAFAGQQRAGFTNLTNSGSGVPGGSWTVALKGRVVQNYVGTRGARQIGLRSTVDVSAPGGKFGLAFGTGDGALALGGTANLGMTSDFDPYSGGVNPLLGFASGGSHFGAHMQVAPAIAIKVGMTEQKRSLGLDLYDLGVNDRNALLRGDRYRAQATNVTVDVRPAAWLTLSGSATQLDEPDAFLGVRTTVAGAFGKGTVSTGLTLGADAELPAGFSLFGSATGSRSSSADNAAAFRIVGAYSTAFQAGVAKYGLLGHSDSLRLSLAKPLGTARGTAELTQMKVTNRETGERGWVTDRFQLDGGVKRLVLEGLYGTAMFDGRAQVSLFGRGELREIDSGTPRLMLGSQLRLAI
jgi:hypothetical protein